MNMRTFSRVKRLAIGKCTLLVASTALAVVLASCAAQKGGTGPTEPASTSPNGKIAFARLDNRVGQSHIFLIKPDGTGLRKLAAKPVQDNFPAWSPNGKRLAFEAYQDPSGFNIDIYVMNADGSGVKRITKEPTHDRMPSWSPDGTRIAFLRGRWKPFAEENTGGIYTIRADGTDLRQLTDNPADEYPAWSPAGKTIAFNRLSTTSGGIYTVNAEGGRLRQLTDPPEGFWDSQPSWSPDGTKIAFTRGSGGRPGRPDVFAMNADGTHLRKLTGKTEGAHSPDFSPDGKKIVFIGWEGGDKLAVMNADGTNVRRLTPDSKGIVNESDPDWQPLPSS
jgi:Tol biopolymer transport system component